jgi:protocatechuate 4,5-dioxygenase beta chain
MTHNPRIFWNPHGPDERSRQDVFAIFRELRSRLAARRPDRLIVVGNDHLDNFLFDDVAPFCVGVAPEASGPFWYESEVMNIPPYRARIDQELGQELVHAGEQYDVEFATVTDFRLDHAFCVPLATVRPEQDLPIVPIFTNLFTYPLPSERCFFEVGRSIGALIAARPATERIAVVTTFNLSVDVGGPRMGTRDESLDREALDLIRAGKAEDILSQLTVPRLMSAGNSTAEFLNYDVILGLVEDRAPDFMEYRRVPGWGGCPAVLWDMA